MWVLCCCPAEEHGAWPCTIQYLYAHIMLVIFSLSSRGSIAPARECGT